MFNIIDLYWPELHKLILDEGNWKEGSNLAKEHQ